MKLTYTMIKAKCVGCPKLGPQELRQLKCCRLANTDTNCVVRLRTASVNILFCQSPLSTALRSSKQRASKCLSLDDMQWTAAVSCVGLALLLCCRWVCAFNSRTMLPRSAESNSPASHSDESFFEIASRLGTDKVSTNSYHYLYEKYLHPLRSKRLRLFEIGLGCDMPYGPGRSTQVSRDCHETCHGSLFSLQQSSIAHPL